MSFTRLWKAVIVLDTDLEQEMLRKFVELGATGYTAVECKGAGEKIVYQQPFASHSQIRVEIVGTRSICEAIVRHISRPEFASHPVAAYLEGVEVLQPERFVRNHQAG